LRALQHAASRAKMMVTREHASQSGSHPGQQCLT
jgi:hypothetical protein